MMLLRLSITLLIATSLSILFLATRTASVQSPVSPQCANSETSKKSNFRFHNYISFNEKGSIEDMGDTDAIESFLTCHFQGHAPQEFVRFFKQLVDWQNQRDREEKQFRQRAMQRLVDSANSKLRSGEKPLTLDMMQDLAGLADKRLIRSIYKDRSGYIIFSYCHLLPEQIALRLAESYNFVTMTLVNGPICWKLRLLEKSDGSIERVETVGTPFGPWP